MSEDQDVIARVEALAEPMGDYHHYAVALDDGVHLAVLVEDLRAALQGRRCGRLDKHDGHDWTTRPLDPGCPRRTFHCKGHTITEGGWTRCGACGTSGRPHPAGGVECREWAREKAISQGDV